MLGLLSRLKKKRQLMRRRMLERQLLRRTMMDGSCYFAGAAAAFAFISIIFPPAGVIAGAILGLIGMALTLTIILAPLGAVLL